MNEFKLGEKVIIDAISKEGRIVSKRTIKAYKDIIINYDVQVFNGDKYIELKPYLLRKLV